MPEILVEEVLLHQGSILKSNRHMCVAQQGSHWFTAASQQLEGPSSVIHAPHLQRLCLSLQHVRWRLILSL